MKTSICGAKHTKYQPTDNEWACPRCGASDDRFFIDEPVEDSDDWCGKLHCRDWLHCSNCGAALSGKSFAAGLQRKHNLAPCPHCKGTGLIKKEGKQYGPEAATERAQRRRAHTARARD